MHASHMATTARRGSTRSFRCRCNQTGGFWRDSGRSHLPIQSWMHTGRQRNAATWCPQASASRTHGPELLVVPLTGAPHVCTGPGRLSSIFSSQVVFRLSVIVYGISSDRLCQVYNFLRLSPTASSVEASWWPSRAKCWILPCATRPVKFGAQQATSSGIFV